MNDGGPAFPQCVKIRTEPGQFTRVTAPTGMSLRDWFAGQALTGLLANPHIWRATCEKVIREQRTEAEVNAAISGIAYDYADAMLAQREKKP